MFETCNFHMTNTYLAHMEILTPFNCYVCHEISLAAAFCICSNIFVPKSGGGQLPNEISGGAEDSNEQFLKISYSIANTRFHFTPYFR
jgi:hypothetical protein